MDKFASIEAFVAVVDTGSFSKAAERIGAIKSVVSRRVSLLEKHLGVQLLARTTRSQSLTSAGAQFYERAVTILAELDEAEQSIETASTELRGRLKVAAPLSFGLHHLTDALNEFLCEHPAIELDLDLNDREINLVEEGFDMAIRIGELRDSTLIARQLATIRFVTCASNSYLEKNGTPQSPDDLSSHVGLHYSNVTLRQAWEFSDGARGKTGAIPGIRFNANNGDVLIAAAAAGLGIVTMPTFACADWLADGRLVTILEQYRRCPIHMYAVFPPGRLTPRRVQAFTDFLAGRFGELPYWDRKIGISG